MISGGFLILFLFCGIIIAYKSKYSIPQDSTLEQSEFDKQVVDSRKELPPVEYASFNEAIVKEYKDAVDSGNNVVKETYEDKYGESIVITESDDYTVKVTVIDKNNLLPILIGILMLFSSIGFTQKLSIEDFREDKTLIDFYTSAYAQARKDSVQIFALINNQKQVYWKERPVFALRNRTEYILVVAWWDGEKFIWKEIE